MESQSELQNSNDPPEEISSFDPRQFDQELEAKTLKEHGKKRSLSDAAEDDTNLPPEEYKDE